MAVTIWILSGLPENADCYTAVRVVCVTSTLVVHPFIPCKWCFSLCHIITWSFSISNRMMKKWDFFFFKIEKVNSNKSLLKMFLQPLILCKWSLTMIISWIHRGRVCVVAKKGTNLETMENQVTFSNSPYPLKTQQLSS